MRIQDTDRILKESRLARNEASRHAAEEGAASRTWRMISSLPEKLTGLFRRS